MDYKNIKTNKKMDQTLKEMLEMRGDNISLYALKKIEELENQLKPSDCKHEIEPCLEPIDECIKCGKLFRQ